MNNPIETHHFLVKSLNTIELMEISRSVRYVFQNAFGLTSWTEEKIQKHLQGCSDVFLKFIDDKPISYCTLLRKSYKETGDYLWINALAVDRHYQNQGIGKQIVEHLLKQYRNTKYLGGRTQNPSVVRLRQSFCSPVFPLDVSYETKTGKELLDFSRKNIPESKAVDKWGVCKQVYSEGRLGDFPDRLELIAINEMFASVGCNRDNGDTVVIIGQVKN